MAYLSVFREKKPKDHHFKHYDHQLHALQYQNLQIFTVSMEKKKMFSIVKLLLYDAIPCIDLKDLCKEATCTTKKCLPVHHVFHWSFGEIRQNHYG